MGSQRADFRGYPHTKHYTLYRKTMFAAHLQRASLATLSRVGSSTASRSLLSTSSVVRQANQPAGFAKLKQLQKTFNLNNGKRVLQRGGTMDSIGYNFTMLVLVIGGVEWVRVVSSLAFPKK